MRLAFVGFLILMCIAVPSYAQSTRYTSALPLIGEEDGDPLLRARTIKFPNDTVTDNADGTVSVDAGTVTDITRCDETTDDYCFVWEDGVVKLYVATALQAQWPISSTFSYLLLETGDYVLLETGDKIILE